MNTNQKTKLANKGTIITLALLTVAVITVTVIAISTAVAKRNDDPLDDSGIVDNDTPTNTTPDGEGENKDPVNPDTGNKDDGKDEGKNDPVKPTPKYHAPASGTLQKGYSEDVLVFSATMNDHRIHLGLDISGKVGDPVYAFTNGTVEKVFTDPFMGKTVIIDHGDGLKSHYMNLSDQLPEGITAGAGVTGGTVIGAIGETAIAECADEPHLHFELRVNDKLTDPAAYITVPTMAEADEDFEG